MIKKYLKKVIAGLLFTALAVNISVIPLGIHKEVNNLGVSKSYIDIGYHTGITKANAVQAMTGLFVGPGGGGGSGRGGGGGGGRVVASSTLLLAVGSYTVTLGNVGLGGIPGGTAFAAKGQTASSTIFGSNLVVARGGTGGGQGYGGPGDPPNDGSHGGGGCAGGCSATGNLGSTGLDSQKGGNGVDAGNNSGAGGGGGDSADGANASGNVAGAGGDGTTSAIDGTSRKYGCGGGGGANAGGTAGAAGCPTAAAGSLDANAASATANTGSGGGGAGCNAPTNCDTRTGGNGGTAVVVIAWPTGTVDASGCSSTGTSGGNTWCKFTSSGTFTINSFPVVGSPTTFGWFKFFKLP